MTAVPVVLRVLSTVLALALLLLGLVGAVEIVLALLDRPPWLIPHEDGSAWLTQQTWVTGTVRAALAAVAALGLVLLVLALRRGRPGTFVLPPRPGQTPPGVRVRASRRGTEAWLTAAARRTSGVSAAHVRLTRRRADVRVRTATRGQDDLPRDVAAVVGDRLGQLGLDQVRPRVAVTRKETR